MTKKRRRRRRLKKGPVVVLIIILLLAIFFISRLILGNSKNTFLSSLEKSYLLVEDKYNTFINNYYSYSKNDYKVNTNTNITVDKETISFTGDMFLKDKINYYDLNININKNNYNLEMLSKEDKLYYKLDDSKFYYSDFSTSNYEYELLLKELFNSLKDNINNDYLDISKESISINEKEYSSKKITLTIDNNLYKEIMKDFYNNIKSNDSLVNLLVYMISVEDLDKYFNSLSINENIIYNIYLNNDEVVKNEIIYQDCTYYFEALSDYFRLGVNDSYISFSNKKIDIFVEDLFKGSGKYDNSSFSIELYDLSNTSLGNISYELNNDESKLSINLNLSDVEVSINMDNRIDVENVKFDVNTNDSIISSNMSKKDEDNLSSLLDSINSIFTF